MLSLGKTYKWKVFGSERNLKRLSCTCAIFLYLYNYNFSLGVAHYHSVTIPHNLRKTTLFLNTKCDNRHNENYHHNHNYSHINNYDHNHPMFKEVWQRVDCAGQQNASKIDNHRFSLRPSDECSKASLDKSIKRCLCLFLVFICLLKPGQCRPSRGGRLQCNGPDWKELFETSLWFFLSWFTWISPWEGPWRSGKLGEKDGRSGGRRRNRRCPPLPTGQPGLN